MPRAMLRDDYSNEWPTTPGVRLDDDSSFSGKVSLSPYADESVPGSLPDPLPNGSQERAPVPTWVPCGPLLWVEPSPAHRVPRDRPRGPAAPVTFSITTV